MDQIIHRAALKWDLTDLCPLSLAAAKAVYSAHSPRYGSVVVKAHADREQLYSEYEALDSMGSNCVCRVYDFDRDGGCILQERIHPGTPLRSEPSLRRRIDVLAQVFPEIHKSCTNGVSYLDWLGSAYAFCQADSVGTMLLAQTALACSICEEIFEKYPERVLLHGDLHHDNLLLRDDGSYTVIDPKGVVGPPVLDLPRFILNELGTPHTDPDTAHIEAAISLICDRFDYPAEDIRSAYYMESILANVWLLEDGLEINSRQLKLAEDIFHQVIPTMHHK